MKEIFKQIIIDFHQDSLPEFNLREIDFPILPIAVRKAFVVMGMRRSGKTYSLYQHMQSIMQQGIKKEQILYIDFEDDRIDNVKASDLHYILDAYFELYPEYMSSKDIYFYFDEIQDIEGWEKFIRRLLDKEKMSIYISGSSAKMLSKEIATTLRGRSITREVFPFSFREYLHYKEVNLEKNITSKTKNVIKHHLQHYFKYGGFPESFGMGEALYRELLQGYINSVIYRDIIERHKISNVQVLKKLLIHCLQNGAKLLSVNKIYNDFKSQGYAVSKNSLYEFIGYFEDAYCVFSIPLYDFSVRKSSLKPKKIYPADQGLITAYTLKPEFEQSTLLETIVFSHLRRTVKEIYYYQTKSGNEVDFLTHTPEGEIKLYQVSLSLQDPKTKQRELSSLQQAMDELKISAATIITLDEEDQINCPNGSINCLPLWKFLLDVSDMHESIKKGLATPIEECSTELPW